MTTKQFPPGTPVTDRPLAIEGLISYRAKGRFGWIMIGAKDDADALREARRTSPDVTADALQVWDGQKYVPIASARDAEGIVPSTTETLQPVESTDQDSTVQPRADAPS